MGLFKIVKSRSILFIFKLLIASEMVCLSSVVSAQSLAHLKEENAPILTLASLQDEVLKANQEIEAARLEWEMAKEEIPQADSLEDPIFTLTQWALPSLFQLGDAEERWYGISQGLPFPGKRSLRSQIAAKGAEAAEQEYWWKRREVVHRVKAAYYKFFLINKSSQIYLEHQALLKTFSEIATKKYALGQVSQNDLLKANLEQTKLQMALLVFEREKVAIRAEINALRNRPPDAPVGEPEAQRYRPFLPTMQALTEQALQKRPDLLAARLMIEKEARTVALAQKNDLPDFMIETAYMDLRTASSDAWMLSVKMNLPWFFTAKYNARARQARFKEAHARAGHTTLLNAVRSDMQDKFAKVKNAEVMIKAYQNGLLPQAEQSLSAAHIGYQSGNIDFIDLLESERALLDFQHEALDALIQFWEFVAEIEHAVGEEITF